MNLYLISQTQNTSPDTYDDAVVCAENEDDAAQTHPCGTFGAENWDFIWDIWCKSPGGVTVELLGVADQNIEPGVVCASFRTKEK